MLTLLLILTVTVVVFLPSLNNGFISSWDDNKHLLDNRFVQEFNINKIFTTTVNETYIPLTIASFAVEYRMFKDKAFVYHFHNLLLYLIVISLVFIFAHQLGFNLMAAAFGALLFAVHPLHVESVAWVTERKDVLYGALYMASIVFYMGYLKQNKKMNYFLCLGLGVLSLLAKPMAISLPLILLACDFYEEGKVTVRRLIEKIPLFIFILPLAWMTYSLNARVPELHALKSPLIWIWSCVFYLKKFLFPLHLFPLYQAPQPVGLGQSEYYGAALLFIAFCFCLWMLRKQRVLMFSALFYILSIFFLMRFDTRADINIVADRYMFLPMLGFCLAIGFYVEKICFKNSFFQKAFVSAFIIIIGLLSMKTFAQCSVWKEESYFWDYVIEDDSQHAVAFQNRGLIHFKKGEFRQALESFNKAIDINPGYVDAYNNRGALFVKLNKPKLALKDFDEIIFLAPDFVKAYVNRGQVYTSLKKVDLAIEDYSRALEIDPEKVSAYLYRGHLYLQRWKYKDALDDFNKILKINTEHKDALKAKEVLERILNK